MLLSMLFPLHERSAMNLSGAVNTAHRADTDEQARLGRPNAVERSAAFCPCHEAFGATVG